MSNLPYRQSKIQERRKNTPWRDFVMEIASRKPLSFTKNRGIFSQIPDTERSPQVISFENFGGSRESLLAIEPSGNDFFGDMKKLFLKNPFPAIYRFGNSEQSDYTSSSVNIKNCYLGVNLSNSEHCVYSTSVKDGSNNVFSSLLVAEGSNNIYNSSGIFNGYNIFYSRYLDTCQDIWFSTNLINCSECIRCDKLEGKKYYIDNIEYSKDEYYEKKHHLLINTGLFENHYQKVIDTPSVNKGTDHSTGKFLIECNELRNGYIVYNVHNSHNVALSGTTTENEYVYDSIGIGTGGTDNFYGTVDLASSSHIYNSIMLVSCNNVLYSINLESCSFCLGCIGLKNKSYCIFNKQYTKEKRYEKVDEIFGEMERDGTLGQFFPATMNPFYFNDTAAYLIDNSFAKEEVAAAGYLWRDEPIKVDIPENTEIVKTSDLGNYEGFDEQNTWTISADILKKVIQDEQGNYYRIIPLEYKFLVKHGLPLPRKHWLERMKENFRIS